MAGWGIAWGTGWSGTALPAAAPVVPATPWTLLRHLQAVVVATGENQRRAVQLLPSSRRFPVEQDPAQGAHRRFELLWTGGRVGPAFGAGSAFITQDLVARVAYFRGGGTAGRGDRISVNDDAGSDATLLQDALCDPRNWDPQSTGIREISFAGASLAVDAGTSVVWETRFRVETEVSPYPL